MVAVEMLHDTCAEGRVDVEARLRVIEARLEAGFDTIERGIADGRPEVERWERIWLQLLDEYEHVYKLLAA